MKTAAYLEKENNLKAAFLLLNIAHGGGFRSTKALKKRNEDSAEKSLEKTDESLEPCSDNRQSLWAAENDSRRLAGKEKKFLTRERERLNNTVIKQRPSKSTTVNV